MWFDNCENSCIGLCAKQLVSQSVGKFFSLRLQLIPWFLKLVDPKLLTQNILLFAALSYQEDPGLVASLSALKPQPAKKWNIPPLFPKVIINIIVILIIYNPLVTNVTNIIIITLNKRPVSTSMHCTMSSALKNKDKDRPKWWPGLLFSQLELFQITIFGLFPICSFIFNVYPLIWGQRHATLSYIHCGHNN